MVQEQLTCHQEEGEVVESPAKEAHTNFVVEALESDVVVITVAALPSKNSEPLDCDVEPDKRSGAPPDYWVSNEIDLSTIR